MPNAFTVPGFRESLSMHCAIMRDIPPPPSTTQENGRCTRAEADTVVTRPRLFRPIIDFTILCAFILPIQFNGHKVIDICSTLYYLPLKQYAGENNYYTNNVNFTLTKLQEEAECLDFSHHFLRTKGMQVAKRTPCKH